MLLPDTVDERHGPTSLHKANIDVLPYWPWSISDEGYPKDADNRRFPSKSPVDGHWAGLLVTMALTCAS